MIRERCTSTTIQKYHTEIPTHPTAIYELGRLFLWYVFNFPQKQRHDIQSALFQLWR